MITLFALSLGCASCAPLPPPVAIEAACTVTDGDTIRCGDERIRLTGIDAPELGGACRGREGRVCVEGDGAASAAALRRVIDGQGLTIRRLGEDRYGRTLGVVYAGTINLSCAQLRGGQAEYVKRWDNRRAVAGDCPEMVGTR